MFSLTATKIAFACSAALLFASCEFKGIKGSGNITTEERPVTEDFKSIEISNALDLTIRQSDKAAIQVEADDNVQRHIKTTVENGVLIIKCDHNSFFNTTRNITVSLPVLEALQASNGSTVKSENVLHARNISIRSGSAASIDLRIEAEKASCEASSGSQATLSGKALELESAASSGSGIDAEKLLSNEVIANASSGGTVSVHPLVRLKAEASSGGNINYQGTPKTISQSASSGGTINRQ